MNLVIFSLPAGVVCMWTGFKSGLVVPSGKKRLTACSGGWGGFRPEVLFPCRRWLLWRPLKDVRSFLLTEAGYSLGQDYRGRRRACRFFSAGCVVCRGRLDGGQAGCGDGRDYGRFCCSGQPCGSGRYSSRRQDCERDGHPVDKWAGNMEGVRELIMLGEHDRVVFTVQRPGHEGEMEISCGFRIPETSWWQRSGMRQVGLMQAMLLRDWGSDPQFSCRPGRIESGR